jgi:hypothetical protein
VVSNLKKSLLALALGLVLILLQSCGGGGTSASPVSAVAASAFQYGYPLTELMRLCDANPSVNQFVFQTALTTAADRDIVNPNNDTLYGKACVYLGSSWVTITMPPANGRYMSMQVFDAYTNTLSYKDPSQIPTQGSQYVLHLAGSSSTGLPAGIPVIEVPTPYAFVITRTFVNNPSDLNAAIAAENTIVLTPNSTTIPSSTSTFAGTAAQQFFQKLSFYLAENPAPPSDAALVASFAAAGIHPTLTPSLSNISTDQLAAWESAYGSGFSNLDSSVSALGFVVRGGWIFPNASVSWANLDFGTNYLVRAVLARAGILAAPFSSNLYPSTFFDGNGTQLNGNVVHTLTLPAGSTPIDPRGFWSVTLTGIDEYFVPNAINRYSISNRTPGVQFNSDGGITFIIQCNDPGGTLSANWLPAPCGPYRLQMRMYMPTAAALGSSFTIPAVQ